MKFRGRWPLGGVSSPAILEPMYSLPFSYGRDMVVVAPANISAISVFKT